MRSIFNIVRTLRLSKYFSVLLAAVFEDKIRTTVSSHQIEREGGRCASMKKYGRLRFRYGGRTQYSLRTECYLRLEGFLMSGFTIFR